jgi:hypothetical protein
MEGLAFEMKPREWAVKIFGWDFSGYDRVRGRLF